MYVLCPTCIGCKATIVYPKQPSNSDKMKKGIAGAAHLGSKRMRTDAEREVRVINKKNNKPFAQLNGLQRLPDTLLCVDLKTKLCYDPRMLLNKDYLGMLRKDSEDHCTFREVKQQNWLTRRNPRVFAGQFITITQRADGSLHPNFRPLKMGKGFSVMKYAFGVAHELRQALKALIDE